MYRLHDTDYILLHMHAEVAVEQIVACGFDIAK